MVTVATKFWKFPCRPSQFIDVIQGSVVRVQTKLVYYSKFYDTSFSHLQMDELAEYSPRE